ATSFEAMAGFADSRTNLTGSGTPEELTAQNVTAGFWRAIGVAPVLGRGFTPEEERDPNASVVLVSYQLWQRRFGGDSGIIGRTIQLNGNPKTVTGVMPPDLRLLMKSLSIVGKPIEVWAPWVLPANAREPRGRFMSVLARLKPGVTFEQSRTEMQAIAAALTT